MSEVTEKYTLDQGNQVLNKFARKNAMLTKLKENFSAQPIVQFPAGIPSQPKVLDYYGLSTTSKSEVISYEVASDKYLFIEQAGVPYFATSNTVQFALEVDGKNYLGSSGIIYNNMPIGALIGAEKTVTLHETERATGQNYSVALSGKLIPEEIIDFLSAFYLT